LSEVQQTLYSQCFKEKHRLSPTAFTRDRKLPFPTLVLFLINFIKGSTQDELDQFFQAIHKQDVATRQVSRSALTQARLKLSHRVFLDLLDVVTAFLNQHANLATYHDMRVFAIDGSTIRVPNRDHLIEAFGETGTRPVSRAMARCSIIHDVLNSLTYDAILEHYSVGEGAMAFQHIEEADLPPGSLILMDRYYADTNLLEHILEHGHQFCFRLRSDLRIFKAFNRLGVDDAIMSWKLLNDKHGNPVRLRVVRYKVGNEVFTLATTLLDQRTFSLQDLKDLYHQRWQVEESYKVKKCRLRIEDSRALTPETIRQDFYAKVFAECLTAALMLDVDQEVRTQRKGRRHEYKICKAQALAKMKNTIVLLFVRPKIGPMLQSLFDLFRRSLVACVPGRRYKRRPGGKGARKLKAESIAYALNR